MGGSVDVKSEVGFGSTFSITLTAMCNYLLQDENNKNPFKVSNDSFDYLSSLFSQKSKK